MKSLYLSILVFLMGTSVGATPLISYFNHGADFASRLAKSEKSLREQIQKLDRQNARSGSGSTLTLREKDALARVLREVAADIDWISSRFIDVDSEFRSLALHSAAQDRFSSIKTIFEGAGRDAYSLSQRLLEDLPREEVLGEVKAAYFSVVDAAGNLVLSIADAVELSSPTVAQARAIKKIVSTLNRIHLTGQDFITSDAYSLVGPRTVTYLSGSTFGSAMDVGPSNLSGVDARQVELRVLRERRAEIGALAKGTTAVTVEQGLFDGLKDGECGAAVRATAKNRMKKT